MHDPIIIVDTRVIEGMVAEDAVNRLDMVYSSAVWARLPVRPVAAIAVVPFTNWEPDDGVTLDEVCLEPLLKCCRLRLCCVVVPLVAVELEAFAGESNIDRDYLVT